MPTPGGERFCVQHVPTQQPVTQAWVMVHGFAEELNKCRRMVALQARALAAQGAAVLLIDLKGCGDSGGEFGDATWAHWVDDVVCAMHWMHAAHQAPLGLWAIRAGCLLAVEAAQHWDTPLDALFWQPVTSGQTHLTQFTRLIAAANWSAGEHTQASAQQARAAWQAGRSFEIAGYDISAAMAHGLQAATLQQQPPALRRAAWFQVHAQGAPTHAPAAQDRNAQTWRAQCEDMQSHAVEGPPFWNSQEIEVAPALIDASTRWVFAPCPAPALLQAVAQAANNGVRHA
jgi:uncharacterized protein